MICENCGQTHNGTYASGRFCSSHCAHAFSTKNDKGNKKMVVCIKCGKQLIVDKRAPNKYVCEQCKIKKCKYLNDICNNVKNCCLYELNICKKNSKADNQKINNLLKYNIIKETSLGNNEKIYNDIVCSKKQIIQLLKNGLSSADICKLLFGSAKHGNTIFKTLNISGRNLSEAVSNAFLQGKMKPHEGWYKTWNKKEVYLRSSYEVEYAKKLDKQKINYEVENLHIKYLNTQDNKYHCAIPDFYIPSTNTIVEIKSFWTLDIQNMKDKFMAYKELGYKCKLILEHKETDLYAL